MIRRCSPVCFRGEIGPECNRQLESESHSAATPQPNLSSELQQCRESVPIECELFLRPEIQSSVPRRMTIATLK